MQMQHRHSSSGEELCLNPLLSLVWHTVVIVLDFPWHCWLSVWLSLKANVSNAQLCSTWEGQIAKGCLALAPTAEKGGHSQNCEHYYNTRSTSSRTIRPGKVVTISVWHVISFGGDRWWWPGSWRGQLIVMTVVIRGYLESSVDFPVLLFVSTDCDVTPTRCFPSLWWKDHHGGHFLSCLNFLTVWPSWIIIRRSPF